jgi:ATP-dependent helicase/nuclease subunit A
VIDCWGRGVAVLAGAGSGKTTTLVAKCEELLRRNPEARLAAVSFTERSAGDLRAKLSLKIGLGSGNHWVMTIHALCAAILREFPREAGYDGEEAMLAEPESRALWEQAVQALWSDDLPEEVALAMDRLLGRESRLSVVALLNRVRGLASFGALAGLLESASDDERALGRAARFALDRYERAKRRRGALDFDDLERGADRALEHAHVRARFRERFDLVLVDEFQDTNPVQARVIWRFVRPDASNLVVVGDPKQSIYRFRDADVSVFEQFCARLPERRSLTWNFRSRPGIIDYVNSVCSELFPSSELPYEPLVPKREVNPEVAPVARVDVDGPADLAAFVRSEMARGLRLEQMALLLRKIRGNEDWLRALTAAGIPIAVGSGGLFWEDPRVRELVDLLRWWDNPGNSLAGASFLRAPWVAVPDVTIDAWIKQDPTLLAPFFESGHPIAVALLGLRGLPIRPGELLLGVLLDAAVEAELGSAVLGLWHRAEEMSSRGMDFGAIASDLYRAIREQRRERDVPPPLNQGQLPVLTLHGAKGLEFEHVILIDFGKKPRAPDMPLLFWDRKTGVCLGGRTPDGDRDRENPIEARLREEERRKELAESKRVFYVALTRAKERLVLVHPKLEEKEQARIKPEIAVLEDFWRSWLECAQAQPVKVDWQPVRASRAEQQLELSLGQPSRSTGRPSPRLVRPRHSVTEWNLLARCPRAYEWTYIRPRRTPEQAAREPVQLESGLPQRELGTRVHACLEAQNPAEMQAGLERLEKEAGHQRFRAQALLDWARSSPWMMPSAPGHRVWTELSFETPISGEVLVGSLDRLLADDQGTYTVIDFKVTARESSPESLTRSYQAQIDLYAHAVRALDPGARRVDSALIQISPAGVQVVPVSPRPDAPAAFAQKAAAIVAGAEGAPNPSEHCSHCPFRAACPEGSAIS